MSGCLDRVSCDCDCAEPAREWIKSKRNMFASIISGTLFAMGWWFVIDACAEYATPLYAAYFTCGIFSTIALLMINAVSMGQVTGSDDYTDGCLGKRAARAWLFVGFILAFGGLVGSLWIFIQQFLVPAVISADNVNTNTTVTLLTSSSNSTGNSTLSPTPTPTPTTVPTGPFWWQGIAFFLQNLFIFLSTLVFKFGRIEEEESSW